MTIWFDMDGTIADLYGVENWLPDIIARNTRPYEMAKGIGNLSLIARLLNKAQQNGHKVGIISWTAKNGCADYNMKVAIAKQKWLNRHLNSVQWDAIKNVEYGTNKRNACGAGILFDDEEGNRKIWGAGAYEPDKIVEVLKNLVK